MPSTSRQRAITHFWTGPGLCATWLAGCRAYGLTAEQLKAQLSLYNPIEQLEGLASAKVPIYLLHGDADEVVPLKENSGEFVERYHSFGGPITLYIVPGGGHTMWEGWFHHQPLVDFVLNQGRSRRH